MPVLRLFLLNVVVFPGQRQTLHIFEPRYRQLLQDVLAEDAPFGIALITAGHAAGGGAAAAAVGCAVRVQQVQELPDGRYIVICRGTQRFRVLRLLEEAPYLRAEVAFLPPPPVGDTLASGLAAAVRALFVQHQHLRRALQDGWQAQVLLPPQPARLVDYMAGRIDAPAALKQSVLEAPSAAAALTLLQPFLQEENARLRGQLDRARRAKLAGLGAGN